MVFSDGIGLTWTALICGTSAALVAGYAVQQNFKKLKNSPEPKRWLRVGSISQLIIYPVKGCAGVHVKQAVVTKLGLKDGEFLRDRVFMIVDDSGTFQVQMKHPQLALVSVQAKDDGQIILKAPGVEALTFRAPDKFAPEKSCRIFQEKGLKTVDCGDEAAEWLQKFMKKDGMRLVYHHLDKTQRTLSGLQLKFPETAVTADLATFQNYTAYLLIAEESIDELNKHLEKKCTYRNFRPSILVSQVQEPFSEIRWGRVRIGDALLKASKPCERCKITTVTETGTHSPDGEPLKTLSKLELDFGNDKGKEALKTRGIMGLQMGLLESCAEGAVIKVGDPVFVALF